MTALFGIWLLALNPAARDGLDARVLVPVVLSLINTAELAAAVISPRANTCARLVPLVQRSAIAAADRHRIARRRPAFLIQVPVSGAEALRRSCHHGG
jgi:hypothetical protein